MSRRYAVIGNPVEHSRSPAIHAMFAQQTGIDLEYGRILAPLDGFAAAVERFRAQGGSGLNVTLPFKQAAFALAQPQTARAIEAGAVNTLCFETNAPEGGRIRGDNTDGAGLVRDLLERRGFALAGCSALLLGAGGAARGVVGPLLDSGVARLVVANRSRENAERLVASFAARAVRPVFAGFDALEPGFDLILEASGSGLRDQRVPVPDGVFAAASLACDLFYADTPTVFVRQAHAAGCARTCDGLGMLVEQAAESFFVWHGVRPQTEAVYRALRAGLSGAARRPPQR